ncbi:MAG: ArsR/SmtB family transcription factor [Granulosicoccus sp.]
MDGTPNIARIGALIGDNARASMLSALMHGRALTARELALEAGVTPQTASSHLAKLESGNLLAMRRQGRHKYFVLASPEVAMLLESLMGLTAGNEPLRTRTGPKVEAMREARVCYNHLAGHRAIQLYDSLFTQRLLVNDEGHLKLTRKGQSFMIDFGIDLHGLQASRSPLCKECLDWSERRSHLAGSVGRALMTRFEALRWVKRDSASRIVRFSKKGEEAFDSLFF